MISSEEGLVILRNWKRAETVLRLLSGSTPPAATPESSTDLQGSVSNVAGVAVLDLAEVFTTT
jgi:hypothetical protein